MYNYRNITKEGIAMKEIKGGITAAKGFKATGSHVGIKKVKKDLAIITSDVDAIYSGTFTKNVVKAACVKWNMDRYEKGDAIRAIVVNSGNANACTGQQGIELNETMAKTTAKGLDIKTESVLIASTGVIGVPMDEATLVGGINETLPKLGSDENDAALAAAAIMTTDTFMKEIAVEIEIEGQKAVIGGMAKGSGMIHPNMATMLGFCTTDVVIDPAVLDEMVKEIIDDTYNMISVDGDTSTNDMVVVLANGQSGTQIGEKGSDSYEVFYKALKHVNTYLAQKVIHDGEGVTKVIEVRIDGAKDKVEAKLLAKSIITSSLFKTAMFGSDANWGRILCAMGYSGATFDHEKVSVSYVSKQGSVPVLNVGSPVPFDEDYALKVLGEKEIIVDIVLKEGDGKTTAWGCDLSYEYVRINGEYRS